MKPSRATQYTEQLNGPFQMFCVAHRERNLPRRACAVHFPALSVASYLLSSRYPSLLCCKPTSPLFSPSFLFTTHLCCQPATQIRNIQPGVKTSAHKILTACRKFYMATFFFIFRSVSTSCAEAICVLASILMLLIWSHFPTPSFFYERVKGRAF